MVSVVPNLDGQPYTAPPPVVAAFFPARAAPLVPLHPPSIAGFRRFLERRSGSARALILASSDISLRLL